MSDTSPRVKQPSRVFIFFYCFLSLTRELLETLTQMTTDCVETNEHWTVFELIGRLILQVIKVQEELERRERELEAHRRRQIEAAKQDKLDEERRRIEAEKRKKGDLERQELALRKKILAKMKVMEEKRGERQREELRRKVASGSAKLKSAVVMKK